MKYALSFIALAASIIIILLAHKGESGKPHIESLESELRVITHKIETLRAENEGLKNKIEAYKNDPYAIERAAREQFGMVKSGEIILQFNR